MTKFSTGKGSEHVGDEYFLTSGDKVRFFFEEGLLLCLVSNELLISQDAIDADGNLTRPKAHAVNKIGQLRVLLLAIHGFGLTSLSYLHVLSPPFAELLSPSSRISPGSIARSLGFKDPRCLQSMIICKQPEIGGAVPPHQDSTFLYTDPPSAVGFWVCLLFRLRFFLRESLDMNCSASISHFTLRNYPWYFLQDS